jgi:hypothetical protein
MNNKNYGWSKDEIDLFAKLYPTSSIGHLTKMFPNKSKHTIYSYATLKGLKKIDRGTGQRKGSLKVLFNNSFQSLYWVGFLFADGCINRENRLRVSSSSQDKNQMERFADYISSTVYEYKNKGGTKINPIPFFTYSVSIGDPIETKKLMEIFDFKYKKTYNPPSQEILQKELNTKEKFISFFIGFIDGDGWICVNNKTLKSSLCLENHNSWLKIHNWFISQLKFYKLYDGKSIARLCKPSKKSTTRLNYNKTSKFQLYGNIVENIKEEIYKLKLKVLDRKWNKVTASKQK